jgi:hypothetical protein
MVGEAGIDAAANHVGGEQRDVAGTPGEHVLRAALERGDEGMDSHLPDDRALAQRLLVELGASAGRPQRALAQLRNNDLGIEFGTDDRDLGVAHAELGEHLLGDIEHPREVAIAAGHAAAAEDHGAAGLLAGLHHVPEVGLHRLALKIFRAGSEIIGPRVHGAGVGDDGVDAALERFVE